jgi:hypothetical protein
MKLNSFSFVQTIILLLIIVLHFHCKKPQQDIFCEIQRSTHQVINNKEGMIVFSNKYERYAIRFSVTNPNNIDSEVIGFVCNLAPELQFVGLKVIADGTFKKFNARENITPELGGQELYFFEALKLARKE